MVVGFFLSSTGDCGGIMGKGLSAGMSRGNKGGSSNSGGRRTAQDFIDDMKRLDGDKQYGSSKSEDHSDDDEPCIGLCYYKKILEEEQNKMERDQASIEEDDVPSSTLNPSISSATSPKGTQSKWVLQKAVMPLTSGCVGLCYHYQKKGDMTTYRKIMKKFQTLPKSRLSTRKPCVGICLYYKKLGIPDPYLQQKGKA